jgi:hypothetical protein
MRYEILAREDVDDRIGDRHFVVKAGETIEVSAKGVEVALSTGKFKYVKEVPETEIEKKRAAEAEKTAQKAKQQVFDEKVQTLLKLTKEELVKKAEALGLENISDLKKEPLAINIAEAEVNKGGVK